MSILKWLRTTTVLMSAAVAALPLLGCAGTAPALTPDEIQAIYKNGCGAVSIADGYFQAAAPALVKAAKLTQADLDKEKAVFGTAQQSCANPPADLAVAGQQLVSAAATIYLMLSN